ncbi:MAG: hypothetical protein PWP07_51 [Epulopiscium sp.]|nr:hypothetical protein [Defluviitaleaceae bacterium]MDK2786826.1 hypothetical protein [Candidatus Epulonipiscium sp.]HHW68357.1 hypothetical protein [Candidatus Epulonipiscium sp.]
MKKKAIVFLGFLAIVYSVVFLQIGNNKNGERTLLSAFNNSEFETIQINLNSWGLLSQSFSDLEEMKKESKRITDALGIYEIDHTEEKDSETFREFTVIRASQNAKTTVKLETIKYEEQNSASTYVVIDMILYGQYNSIPYLKEEIDSIFSENNIKPTTNITIAGTLKDVLSKEEKEKIAKNIMKDIGAKIEETYETDEIYSVYGYTRLIDDWLISNGKKINVNLAFHYNEYEGSTYLYLATPVITVDY